jgi:hypothetical protein
MNISANPDIIVVQIYEFIKQNNLQAIKEILITYPEFKINNYEIEIINLCILKQKNDILEWFITTLVPTDTIQSSIYHSKYNLTEENFEWFVEKFNIKNIYEKN